MNCQHSPEISFIDWLNEFQARLPERRFPIAGILELTSRCNLRCVHCYIKDAETQSTSDLSTVKMKQIIDQIADAGTLFLLITGGEPLLRKDFGELYIYARSKGILVTLFTNGTLLTEEIIKVLNQAPPLGVEITAYGATKLTYEAVTQVPGSFDKFMHGLELLQVGGIKFDLKSMVLKQNVRELEQLKSLAKRYSDNYKYDTTIWPRLDGSSKTLESSLTLDEIIELDFKDKERLASWQKMYVDTKGVRRKNKMLYDCGAGYRSYLIDSSGRMSMCVMSRKPAYNVFETGFAHAWQLLGEERENNLRPEDSECYNCESAGICLHCPGWAQLSGFDSNDKINVDYCKLNKRRVEMIVNSLVRNEG